MSSSPTRESCGIVARSKPTIHNADKLLQLSGGTVAGFQNWLRGFADYAELQKAHRREFKFMDPSGIYMWLWAVGEDIPYYHDVFGD
jgi:hypothetical protein